MIELNYLNIYAQSLQSKFKTYHKTFLLCINFVLYIIL